MAFFTPNVALKSCDRRSRSVNRVKGHGLYLRSCEEPYTHSGAYAEIHHSYQCIALVLYRLTN